MAKSRPPSSLAVRKTRIKRNARALAGGAGGSRALLSRVEAEREPGP